MARRSARCPPPVIHLGRIQRRRLEAGGGRQVSVSCEPPVSAVTLRRLTCEVPAWEKCQDLRRLAADSSRLPVKTLQRLRWWTSPGNHSHHSDATLTRKSRRLREEEEEQLLGRRFGVGTAGGRASGSRPPAVAGDNNSWRSAGL